MVESNGPLARDAGFREEMPRIETVATGALPASPAAEFVAAGGPIAMTTFDYAASGLDVHENIIGIHRASWQRIARPGSHWTAAERVEIARQSRASRAARGEPPWARTGLPDAGDTLPDAAVEAARTIGADAHKIDRAWAEKMIASLGDARYVELGAVVATMTAIDAFAEAVGRGHEPLPDAVREGEPDGARLLEATDAGAYVPMMEPWQGPNVARALSLVPDANALFMSNVMCMYGGPGGSFYDLAWSGPLSRPQAELLAARVSALNECFY